MSGTTNCRKAEDLEGFEQQDFGDFAGYYNEDLTLSMTVLLQPQEARFEFVIQEFLEVVLETGNDICSFRPWSV